MTAKIISITATSETETPEAIASRCIAAGMDGKIINTFAIARAVARAIQAERDRSSTYRKRCADLVRSCSDLDAQLRAEQKKWEGEWG